MTLWTFDHQSSFDKFLGEKSWIFKGNWFRVQTNFKNSAEILYLAEFRIPFQPNRTCFSKVRFWLNWNRNWLKKFGFNRNLTEFSPLLILVFLRLKILKFKFVWTETGTEFCISTEFSCKAYFNFRILSLKNTNINKGKNSVKFRLKPNFFSQFRFRLNRNRTFEKQIRFGWKGIRNSAEHGISAEFLRFVCTLLQPQLVFNIQVFPRPLFV